MSPISIRVERTCRCLNRPRSLHVSRALLQIIPRSPVTDRRN